MPDLSSISKYLLGQIAWGVARGPGSFLHIEFGDPHLVVREPISPRTATAERAKRALKRRHAHVEGDWTLWIEYGDWRLQTEHAALDSETAPGGDADECLRDLNGQRLVSVAAGSRPNGTVFKFDLGAVLEVWPSAEIADTQWSLKSRDGSVASFGHDSILRAGAG